MLCAKCGTELPDGVQSCLQCGHRVAANASMSTTKIGGAAATSPVCSPPAVDETRGRTGQHWYDDLTLKHWNVLLGSFLGWVFDGYESYALIVVLGPALKSLLSAEQLKSQAVWAGLAIGITLLGWGTGGLIGGILADYIGRKKMMMYSVAAVRKLHKRKPVMARRTTRAILLTPASHRSGPRPHACASASQCERSSAVEVPASTFGVRVR